MYKDLTISTDQVEYLKRIFRAAANFYKIIILRELYEIITLKYGHDIPEDQFIAFAGIAEHDEDRGFYSIASDDELYTDGVKSAPMDMLLISTGITENGPDVFYDFMDAKEECPLRLKILPEEELLRYEDDWYMEETPEFKALRQFFIKSVGLRDDDLLDVLGSLEFNSKEPDLSSVMRDALRWLELCKVKLTRSQSLGFLRLWIPFHNKLKMPALNGHDPTEARELGYEFLNSYIHPDSGLPEILVGSEGPFVGQADLGTEQTSLPVRVQKPGRNDPCPCGSGKKYKKCCGR